MCIDIYTNEKVRKMWLCWDEQASRALLLHESCVIMHKGYRIFRPADPRDYKSLQPFPAAENLKRSPL